MDLGITGKTALITGGDSGIGLATAKFLFQEGANVLINGRHQSKLEEALCEIKELGSEKNPKVKNSQAEWIAADLSKTGEAEKLAREAAERFGHVDIVAHAAGIHGSHGDFLTLSDADWLHTLQTDLMGAVRVCRSFIPQMREKKWGRIVLIASENALQPYPGDDPYNVCKAGIINLARSLSKAYSPDGVLINSVSPAFINTPMTDEMMDKLAVQHNSSRKEAVQWFLKNKRPGIVTDRRGRPEEVAKVIGFLCSEAASFVTGSNYRVDGGSVATAF